MWRFCSINSKKPLKFVNYLLLNRELPLNLGFTKVNHNYRCKIRSQIKVSSRLQPHSDRFWRQCFIFSIFNHLIGTFECVFDSRSMRKVKNSNPMLKRMIVRCFFNKKSFFLDSFYYVKFHFKILIIE